MFTYCQSILETACLELKINLTLFLPLFLCLFFPLSPFSHSNHPSFSIHFLVPSLPLSLSLPLFFSLHQYSRPMTVPGLRKWMVCLFLETGKEGKPKLSYGGREREGRGGMWGEDKSAFYRCLWSETVWATEHAQGEAASLAGDTAS